MKPATRNALIDTIKAFTKGALSCALFVAALGAAEWISR